MKNFPKDIFLIGPLLISGIFTLNGISNVTSGRHTFSGNGNTSALVLYVILLMFQLGLLFAWYRGKEKKVERLSAIEHGYNPADLEPANMTPARAIIIVGLGVPLGIFALAWLASVTMPAAFAAVWPSAAIVIITTLVCGTVLLTRLPTSVLTWTPPAHAYSSTGLNGKPSDHDPDTIDVVGRRG